MSPTTLIRSATMLVTMDEQRREIADGALLIEDNAIVWVGSTSDLPPGTLETVDRILDATGKIVLPGFVNTHHHFYQTLTRVVPGAQDAVLFDWLKTLYPIWAELTPDDVFVSTQLALTELLLSGTTTSSDHHYLWPNGARLDDQFAAAATVGVRFHGARGSMSLGESKGGLPPDRVTEDEEAILRDSRRVVETFHDPEAICAAPRRTCAVQPFQRNTRADAPERTARPQFWRGDERTSAYTPGGNQG